jgi:hypothetical protein
VALTPKNDLTREEKLAQRDAAEQEALLREVDDAVRAGDLESFMSQWGKPLLGVVVAGLAAFGGYLYWDHRQELAKEKDSEVIVGALDQINAGNLQSGYDALAGLASDIKDGPSVTAAMLRAGIAAEQKRPDEAAKIFAAVAADEDAPQAMRDLAKLREVALKYDTMKSADVIAALKPLAVPGKPFFPSAAELMAHSYIEEGKRAEAGALLAQIAKDDTAPDSLRSRSRQLAGVLGVDAIEDVDKLLEEQGVNEESADGSTAAPQAQ